VLFGVICREVHCWVKDSILLLNQSRLLLSSDVWNWEMLQSGKSQIQLISSASFAWQCLLQSRLWIVPGVQIAYPTQQLLPFLKFHISQNHGSSRDQIGILLNTFQVTSMLPTFGVHTNDAIMNISIWHKTKQFVQSLYEFACYLRVLIM
jgi:hypothetical protein